MSRIQSKTYTNNEHIVTTTAIDWGLSYHTSGYSQIKLESLSDKIKKECDKNRLLYEEGLRSARRNE